MNKSLTPTQIAKILDTLEVLNKIGDAVKARAVELAHNGVKIPGWEASFTPAKRIWTDEDEAAELLDGLGLTKRERYSIELLSPAAAEKLLRSKKLWPKKPRGSAEEDFANPFKPVLGYTETKQSIRKVGDT